MKLQNQSLDKEQMAEEVIAKLTELGAVTSKKMFGGIGLFLDGLMFAKISGNGTVFLKVDDSNRADYEALGGEKFHSANKKKGMPYYEVPPGILDDDSEFLAWAKKSYGVAITNRKS